MEPDKVVIIVRNFSGQLFTHQRNANKKTFPLMYGLGAGGHVEPEEKDNPWLAATRELDEELKIPTAIKFLFSINYKSLELTHTIHVFEALWNEQIEPCEEFAWSGWLSIKQIDDLSRRNLLCPDTKVLYERYKMQIE
jgi:8-oxo-dGTP pyrophosphatase MutT (NUDIX family)